MACYDSSANGSVVGIETRFGTIGDFKEKGATKGSIVVTSGCETMRIMLSSGFDSNSRDIMEVVKFSPLGTVVVE